MKILYDHQIFSYQRFGGISRYYTQIISNLQTCIEYEIAIRYSDNEYLNQLKLVEGIGKKYFPIDKFLPGINFRGKGHLFEVVRKINETKYNDCYSCNKNLSIELLKKQDFDVFHPTYFDDYFLDYLGSKPFILTIHDMIHEIYPEMLNDNLTSKRKARLAEKADHIIAVSESTKEQIIEIFGIPRKKISVVYHANSLEFGTNNNLDLPEKYVLYVGERSNYKNFMFFVRSIHQVFKKDPEIKLICSGRPFSESEIDFFNSLGITGNIVSLSVNDNGLAELYRRAIAFFFPSYAEGFGIPIIEAFTVGCPVVLSNITCFREVAGDAALYFDPKSAESVLIAIKEILYNNSLRKSLILKGKDRAERFSWKGSARKTFDIYNLVNSN